MISRQQPPDVFWLDLRSQVTGVARLLDRIERTALESHPSHRQRAGGRNNRVWRGS